MEAAPRRSGRPRDEELTARRREEILTVAAEFFAAHGYRGTDVQEVADRLEVGKGTVYRYFPSKRELFLGAVDRGMRELQASVAEATEGVEDPLRRIEMAIRTYLAYFEAHPDLVELFMQERAQFRDRATPTYFEHQNANTGPWRQLLLDLMAAGRVRQVPVERITDVTSALLYGTIFTNYFAGRQKPHDEQAGDILDLLFNGILSQEES